MTARARTGSVVVIACVSGILLGVFYTFSPLTVLCALVLVWVLRSGSRDLSAGERRWFLVLVIAAVAARVMLVAALFVVADPATPYATFFGDEELFKNRSVWIRNLALGLSVSPADIIYAVDETGRSSYLYVLALLQALVGNAPYGVHVLNATLFVTSTVVLYRVVRAVFGGLAAMAGLGLLLYLPTLFVWSVSALKEPLYTAIAVLELIAAFYVARGDRWWQRAMAFGGVLLAAIALESVRKGGFLVAIAGALVGLSAAAILARPRRLIAAALVLPVVAAVLLSSGAVRARLLQASRDAAVYHAGHLSTPGYSYQLIDPRYYDDRNLLARTFSPRESVTFSIRAIWSYIVEPLPWKGESLWLRAYLPEQIVWWLLVALLPFGVLAGLRIDPVLTLLLCAHAVMIVIVVALTSGNAGTLIRHRGLVFPYVVWLSAFGAVAIVRWMAPAAASSSFSTPSDGDG